MAGGARRAAIGATITMVVSCGDAGLRSRAPACEALVEAARHAAACDPALEPLTAALQDEHDEIACRVAVRRVLDGPHADPPRVRSVWTPSPAPDRTPLSAEELAGLTFSARPAQLRITPDIAPGPGVPPTSADLEDLPLDPDDDGRLHVHHPPGAATLRIRHAGRESLYCVELRACETLQLTAHGDKLARHPGVRKGSC